MLNLKIQPIFLNLYLFFIWFIFCFIGDLSINGFPLIVCSSLLVVISLSRWGGDNGNSNLLSYLLVGALLFTLLPSFKAPFSEDLRYYSSFIGILVSIIYILIVHKKIYNNSIFYYICFLFLILMFIYSVTFKFDDTRLDILFGPNILYRIILFFLGVILVFNLYNRKIWIGKIILYSSIILATYLVFRTGSRGGLLAEIFILFVFLYHYYSWKVFYFILFIIFYFIYNYLLTIDVTEFRILRFDGESSEVRLDKFKAISNFLESGYFLTGTPEPSKFVGKVYPHNFLIESLIYHGFFYFLLVFFGSILILYYLIVDKYATKLLIPYLGIYIGMFFSGGYLDNYVGIGLVLLILLLFVKRYKFKNLEV